MSILNFLSIIGKNIKDQDFDEVNKNRDFEKTFSGENMHIASINEGLSLTFNAEDNLIKIEMQIDKKWYQYFVTTYYQALANATHKADIIKYLGQPTAIMSYPQSSLIVDEQILYNKEKYWLCMKFNQEKLSSITLLSPALIPQSIKHNFIPIRGCKSKD
ncbi:MAG: hypothetical protein JSS07_09110 [Proteobacteria bacterium]|nr:hypothetical protein [Pseudomonadota bacterium]